jgi:hypothetical protein
MTTKTEAQEVVLDHALVDIKEVIAFLMENGYVHYAAKLHSSVQDIINVKRSL